MTIVDLKNSKIKFDDKIDKKFTSDDDQLSSRDLKTIISANDINNLKKGINDSFDEIINQRTDIDNCISSIIEVNELLDEYTKLSINVSGQINKLKIDHNQLIQNEEAIKIIDQELSSEQLEEKFNQINGKILNFKQKFNFLFDGYFLLYFLYYKNIQEVKNELLNLEEKSQETEILVNSLRKNIVDQSYNNELTLNEATFNLESNRLNKNFENLNKNININELINLLQTVSTEDEIDTNELNSLVNQLNEIKKDIKNL